MQKVSYVEKTFCSVRSSCGTPMSSGVELFIAVVWSSTTWLTGRRRTNGGARSGLIGSCLLCPPAARASGRRRLAPGTRPTRTSCYTLGIDAWSVIFYDEGTEKPPETPLPKNFSRCRLVSETVALQYR